MIVFSVSQGCQPIIGFNYGARDYKRVIETYKSAAIFICLYCLPVFLCLQIFPAQLLSVFGTASAAFFEFGVRYMRMNMMMMILVSIQLFSSVFVAAIGKPVLGLVASLMRQTFLLLPFMFILARSFGLNGILYASPIADAISFLLTALLIVRELKTMVAASVGVKT